MNRELDGKTALVTGASSGLGVDFARELARRGCGVILVARREDRLRQVAEELAASHGVRAEPIAMDLGSRDAGAALYERVRALGLAVDLLVNNAGYGLHGRFLDLPWERERAMLDLDVIALVDLTKRFGADMAARGWGRILLVASIVAYMPTPTYASYAAAKAFVLHFGVALHEELRGSGVTCTVFSPGPTATEFFEVAGQKKTLVQRVMLMSSARTARIGVRAMLRGRGSKAAGAMNTLVAWSQHFISRRLAARIAGRLMRAS